MALLDEELYRSAYCSCFKSGTGRCCGREAVPESRQPWSQPDVPCHGGVIPGSVDSRDVHEGFLLASLCITLVLSWESCVRRRRPYAVVLFDEVEKAHADVFNILLQASLFSQLLPGLECVQSCKLGWRDAYSSFRGAQQL